jgi:5-methylcytosine-specific restriction endonuclease McrBC GTP-binding regulatory subunit McrB
MKFWKLVTVWGTGSSNFYALLAKYHIVIGASPKLIPTTGDICVITNGHDVIAFADVIENSKPSTSLNYLKNEFLLHEIDYQNHILVSKAQIYKLEEKDRFKHKLQQGLIEIQDLSVKQQIKNSIGYYRQKYNFFEEYRVWLRKRYAESTTDLYFSTVSLGIFELSNKYKFDIPSIFSKDLKEISSLINLWDLENAPKFKGMISFNDFLQDLIKKEQKMANELNLILYGPPGTGKTYNTINKALELCGEDLIGLTRADIKSRFEQKVDEGRIIFTTFHQSMTYEDFIEGIKPIEPDKEGDPVVYRVEKGIFRKLCIEASFSLAKEKESTATEIVLDFSLAFDNFVQEIEEKITSGKNIELATKNGGKVLVDGISLQGNIIIKHYGKDNTYPVSKQRLSKLHAAFPDLTEVNNIDHQFRSIIGGSNSTANWSVLNAIRKYGPVLLETNKIDRKYSWEDKIEVVRALKKEDYKGKTGESYVLIIDEINRGNVSQIFGELITLIEEDKRLGNPEAIEVQLPYSKDWFGVPPNVHIIGTMNTADRSVEALDTALRRRFSFIEMPPNPELIKTEGKIGNGINLSVLLGTINRRIEKLLDKDHMIGHSYFLSVEGLKGLKAAFQNKIIPLLQEYFFGDYGKIGLVIGSEFFDIKDNQIDEDFFAPFDDYDSSPLLERKVYHLKNVHEMSDDAFLQALRELERKTSN